MTLAPSRYLSFAVEPQAHQMQNMKVHRLEKTATSSVIDLFKRSQRLQWQDKTNLQLQLLPQH